MNENPKETGKFSRFFEEKGFYIILFLCVAAIGIAGYVLFFEPANKADDSALVSETSKDVPKLPDEDVSRIPYNDMDDIPTEGNIPDSEPDSGALPASSEVDTAPVADIENEPALNGDAVIHEAVETISSNRQTDTPKVTEDAVTPAEKEPDFFVWPVSGEVIKDFSYDELVYNRTMGDWRTHNGTDFSTQSGAPVSVIADGIVEDIYTDSYYGTSVLVDHGSGLKSVYLGLVENATVTVGQTVAAGDIIGSVSITPLFESLEQAHLHVEMMKDGVRVDPMDYIPTK